MMDITLIRTIGIVDSNEATPTDGQTTHIQIHCYCFRVVWCIKYWRLTAPNTANYIYIQSMSRHIVIVQPEKSMRHRQYVHISFVFIMYCMARLHQVFLGNHWFFCFPMLLVSFLCVYFLFCPGSCFQPLSVCCCSFLFFRMQINDVCYTQYTNNENCDNVKMQCTYHE